MTTRDGTLESVSVKERLQFLNDVEDSESPIRFIDMTGRHYLVYITKTSVIKVEKETDDERMVSVVMVDAVTGLWPQMSSGIVMTASTTVQVFDAFVYDDASSVFETARFS